MCVCIQPSLVFSRLRSKRVMPCGQLWWVLRWKIDSDSKDVGPVASCRLVTVGVCHSLVHWTLPLHRVLLFSQIFFLSPTAIFGFSFGHDDFLCWRLSIAVAVTFFFFLFGFFQWHFQQVVLYSVVIVVIVSVLFPFQWVSRLFLFSVCQTQISLSLCYIFLCMFSTMILKKLLPVFNLLKQCLEKTCARIKL